MRRLDAYFEELRETQKRKRFRTLPQQHKRKRDMSNESRCSGKGKMRQGLETTKSTDVESAVSLSCLLVVAVRSTTFDIFALAPLWSNARALNCHPAAICGEVCRYLIGDQPATFLRSPSLCATCTTCEYKCARFLRDSCKQQQGRVR